MGLEWIVPLVGAVVAAALAILKGIWGTSRPQERKIDHAEPDVEIKGKTDEERLDDLGL